MAKPRKETQAPKQWSCNICAGEFPVPTREGEDRVYQHIRKNLVRTVHFLQLATDDRAELSKHVESVYSSKDGSLASKYDEIRQALSSAKLEREFDESLAFKPLYRIWAEKNNVWRLWSWVNERMENYENVEKEKGPELF